MNQRIISQIGRSQRLAVVNILKRTQGLCVSDLAEKLQLSYMGAKQHCIELAEEGYLDTWRQPVARGRPRMLYRLTHRAHELFPKESNSMTIALLESACSLYGASAAEKLLFHVFQRKGEEYRGRLSGVTLPERAKWLARLRDADGFMADFHDQEGLQIVEHHSPILDLLRAFPIVERLETGMFERLLGAPVRRQEEMASGLYRCSFFIG